MAKLHCATVCTFLQKQGIRSYSHGGARSVIPAGRPPPFIGTYILGNNIIRRRWNHVTTRLKKVHQKILHKHRFFYDSRYEFSIFLQIIFGILILYPLHINIMPSRWILMKLLHITTSN
jgi:hypothetical protein